MHGMKYDPDIPTEPYGHQTASTPIWHLISGSPLTDPKVSSVIVHIEIVEDWENQWLEFIDLVTIQTRMDRTLISFSSAICQTTIWTRTKKTKHIY
jgi:hypothetical protein